MKKTLKCWVGMFCCFSILCAGGVPKASAATKAEGDAKLEKLVEAAKKEGSVSLYTVWPPDARKGVADAFLKKYHINIEYTTFSRGSEMLARVQSEKRAGLFLSDAYGGGSGTLLATMKPAGVFGPLEPLIQPDVLDVKYWKEAKLPFMDKDKLVMVIVDAAYPGITYNADLIKKGEITSYKDLLKPQYKGKIVIDDPSVSGQGNHVVCFLAAHAWNLEQTKDYLSQLIKRQEAVIHKDPRLLIEWVAKGKYAIALGAHSDIVVQFMKSGAPLDVANTKEGIFTSAGYGGISVSTRIVHPNATKLLLNWLLSPEGQKVASQSFGSPGRRIGISAEGINPIKFPQSGQKVFTENEEDILYKGKLMGVMKKFIEETVK